MYYEGFIDGYLVHVEEWYDNTIYFNVRYFNSGQSIHSEPVFDKAVYITNNEKGRNMVSNYKSTLVNYVARLDTEDKKIVLTF